MTDPLEQLLAPTSEAVRATFERLRRLVREAVPDAAEQVDLPDRLVAYGRPDADGGVRMREFLLAIAPHKAHVNVQFADGVALPDPGGLMEGTGKRIRHVKCRSVSDAERPALRALVEEQVRPRQPTS